MIKDKPQLDILQLLDVLAYNQQISCEYNVIINRCLRNLFILSDAVAVRVVLRALP